MEPFVVLVDALIRASVRFVVIGVGGVNHYAVWASLAFTTRDRDLFLPLDPANELKAWEVCRARGMELWCGDEPLGSPIDSWLAAQVVARKAVVRARDGRGLEVDLSLVMAGFEFETVWKERRTFRADAVEVPVARLSHIIASKAAAGREKDRLFLATHEEALRQLGKLDAGED